MSQAIAEMSIGFVPGFGRLMGERVLVQRNSEYVIAARVLGAGEWRRCSATSCRTR